MTELRAHERATALVLVPSMLVVLLSLGAIALDLTSLHAAHRGLHRTVSSAADDAAAMLDGHHLQRTGELRIDEPAARRVALAHLDAAGLPGELDGTPSVEIVDGGSAVQVGASVRVERVVSRLLGADDRVEVEVTGRLRR